MVVMLGPVKMSSGLHVAMLLMLTVWINCIVWTQGDISKYCPGLCHCLDKGSVMNCQYSGLGAIPPLLSTTMLLDMDHNRVSVIYNQSFSNAPRMELLSLEDNGIVHIEAMAFSGLTQLKVLRLGRNHLSHLPQHIFWNNRKLQILDLNSNAFVHIPDYIMVHLIGLQVFNISYNYLASPKLGTGFRYTTQLSSVDLSGNNFVALESNVFQATRSWDTQVTHYLNLSNCNIRHIDRSALSRLYRLEALSLAGNPEVPQDDLRAALYDLKVSSLQILNLSKMNITDIYDFFRRHQYGSLRKLYLSHNSIKEIKKRSLYYLEQLMVLDLSHNKLSSIGDISSLNRLKTLNLAYNRITAIEHQVFEGSQTLNYLDISHNLLGSVTAEPFQKLWEIKELDLSHNQIASFQVDSGLEHLLKLKLSANRLTDLRAIRRLLRLEFLDVSANLLTRLGRQVFTHGHRLELANFSRNAIYDINTDAFRSSSIETLDLSQNALRRLQNYGWRRIGKLYLQDNAISNISVGSFRGLNTLAELNLSGNKIYQIPQNCSGDLYSLQKLDLSHNPLGMFFQEYAGIVMVNQLLHLDTLRLSGVQLKNLHPRLFNNLTQLTHLDLSYNWLTELDPQVFQNMQNKLQYLNVSANKFNWPQPQVFEYLHNLQMLDASYNSFQCTCKLMPFRNWLVTTNVTVPNLHESARYSCLGPPEWEGVSLLSFHLETESCSNHEKAVILAAIGCTVLVVILTLLLILYRYRLWSKRKVRRTNYYNIDDNTAIQINQAVQLQVNGHRDWV